MSRKRSIYFCMSHVFLTLLVGIVLSAIASGCNRVSDSSTDCSEGDSRCDGDMVQQCQGGMWGDFNDCAATDRVCTIIKGVAKCVWENDSDVDTDTDTDIDTDADADTDTDADADTDTDADADTDTDTDCPINSAFPCACNTATCQDSSSCLRYQGAAWCAYPCTVDGDCPATQGFGDVAACLAKLAKNDFYCVLICTAGGNACPPGLTCTTPSGASWSACN